MYSEIYNFIAQNKEMFRIFYSVLIALICFIIVFKTDRLFRVSHHQGIRYFRNAFFFYGIAFILRYLLAKPIYFVNIKIIFEFVMAMASFFLLYSLIWKKIEGEEKSISSLFNFRIFVFYGFALIIAVLDSIWQSYNFLFSSQIIVFGLASIISYNNYKNSKKNSFLGLYFTVMILSLFAWIFNFVWGIFLGLMRLRWVANIYALNVLVFLIFLYGVIKATKRKNG
ncbi:MAG: hypothetical protein AABW67_04050 [Nanoarchaeota archaeon]